jgi:hypothetical protein
MLLAPALACDVSRGAVGQSGTGVTVTVAANRRKIQAVTGQGTDAGSETHVDAVLYLTREIQRTRQCC